MILCYLLFVRSSIFEQDNNCELLLIQALPDGDFPEDKDIVMADPISNHGPQAFHRMDVVTLPILPGHDAPTIKDIIIREAGDGSDPYDRLPIFPWPTPLPQPGLPVVGAQDPAQPPVGPVPYPGQPEPSLVDQIIEAIREGRDPHDLLPVFPPPTPQPHPMPQPPPELPAVSEQAPVNPPVGPLPYPGQPEPSLVEQIMAIIAAGGDLSTLFVPRSWPNQPELPAVGEQDPSPSIPGMMPGFVPGSQPGEIIPVGFPSIDSRAAHEILPPRLPDNWAELLTP
jgi:hypothetical protein